MPLRRRSFLALGAFAAAHRSTRAATPKRILILGGTGFLGPATVDAATARGHKVTLFNRGRTRPGLFPDVEKLHGDRDPKVGDGIKALEGREWDAVIDNSGFVPRIVSASARLLAPHVRRYIYISSISAYAANDQPGAAEDAAVATMADPTVEVMGDRMQNYGALKALCERAAEEAMPDRTANVRPGFIVGPDDPSGRFTYWPVRADRGGDILAPGSPSDPVQFVDVRDLGAWLVRLAEDETVGVFNATGPASRLEWGRLLDACMQAASHPGTLVWASAEFVDRQKGLQFPIWASSTVGEERGFHQRSNRRAIAAGLTFRPYAATVRDTLAWHKAQPADGRVKLVGPTPEQEVEALAAWKARGSAK